LILDAIAAVGPSRPAIIGWLHALRARASPIGTYGFGPTGDTTLRDYGVYRIRDGALAWAGLVRAP
jgi:hypothetical protein